MPHIHPVGKTTFWMMGEQMPNDLKPIPYGDERAAIAKRIRQTAAENYATRTPDIPQHNNGDLEKALNSTEAFVSAPGTFTKGLKHDEHGRVERAALNQFVAALNQDAGDPAQSGESPFPGVYTTGLPATFDGGLFKPGTDGSYTHPTPKGARGWESPISGHTFDLEGCDADATGMPPAPAIGSAELAAEMGEVYCAALLRDVKFSQWRDGAADDHVAKLGALSFFSSEDGLDLAAAKRRHARLKDGVFDASALFRGSTPGAKAGPYISQFLLIGNTERGAPAAGREILESTDAQPRAQVFGTELAKHAPDQPTRPEDGIILYGVQGIPQQFRGHRAGVDHMTAWSVWHDVQNGANLKGSDRFEDNARFIATPRDLATYVHFDALYQAYLNAVLIMLSMEAKTDIGLPEGADDPCKHNRDAFATFGGPHILTLVTEVATRALKAVRRQKFNTHLRSRPEMLGAALSLAWKGGGSADALGGFKGDCTTMKDELLPILEMVAAHNTEQNKKDWVPDGHSNGPLDDAHNALLPMAFPEGSPMHAAYGAGHATVAGACVTVVKAFFEMFETGAAKRAEIPLYDVVDKKNGYPGTYPAELFGKEKLLTGTGNLSKPFEADPNDPTKLRTVDGSPNLSIQGELDKLAANISIGRNFGGVHYYTDYYESLRMGERIAVSILQEQMLTYREPVTMRFTSFDGDHIMIAGTGGSRGANDALVFVWDKDGNGGTRQDFETWWSLHR